MFVRPLRYAAPRQHGNVARVRSSVKRKLTLLTAVCHARNWIFWTMSKKKPDGEARPKRESQRPPDVSPHALPEGLTTAEILAQSPPPKPRRPRKRDNTAKNLGAYDTDRDILDQY